MSNAGFQPVCVLYQGNGSPSDGTCQLVCRHQIPDEDFKQGDVIRVLDSTETHTGGGSVEKRAIVMGKEMVATLIGTIFNTPISQNSRKRRRSSDANEEKPEHREFLKEILETIQDIKVEVMRQGMELSCIRTQQTELETRIVALQHTIHENTQEKDSQCRPDQTQTPKIASVVSIAPKCTAVAEESDVVFVKEEFDPSSTFESGEVEGDSEEDTRVDGGEMHHDSPGHEQGWEYCDILPSLVPESNEQYLKDILKNATSGNIVQLGTPRFFIKLLVDELEDILYKSNSAASFAYRLASKCFTSQEMIEGNTRGGGIRTNGESFKQLNPDAIDSIVNEVKKRFPQSAPDIVLTRCTKSAINERCRNERKKQARKLP